LETAGLPLNLRPFLGSGLSPNTSLLDFLVRLVLAALAAELLHFKAFCRGFLVLGARIVPILALGALKSDDFPHLM
jgi:hypothetical protein